MEKTLQDLNLTDDILFTLLMQQEVFCQQVLNIILNKEFTKKITYQHVKKVCQNLPSHKSIRINIYAEDSDSNIYNVEILKHEHNDLPLSLYHQPMLHVLNQLNDKKIPYNHLKGTYIIFITEQDLFGLNRYQYSFENRCNEVDNLFLQDGMKTIFLNTSGQNLEETDSDLVALLHYLKDTNEDAAKENKKLQQLHEAVTQLKYELKDNYMNLQWFEE